MRSLHPVLIAVLGLSAFAFGLMLLGCAPPPPEGERAADTVNQHRQSKETPPPPAPIMISLSAMSLSPDGKLLVTGYAVTSGKEGDREEGHLVKVWDVATGKRLHVLKGHDGNISFVAFLPDSKRAVTAGGKTLKMWNARAGKQLWSAKAYDWITTSAALSPDGKFVLFWGYENGKTIGSAGILTLCDTATGKLLREFKQYNNRSIGRITFLPDSRHAFIGNDHRLLDVTTGETARFFKKDEAWKYPLVFSPDGKLALSEKQDELGGPFHLVLWEIAGGKVVRRFEDRSDTDALGTSLGSLAYKRRSE